MKTVPSYGPAMYIYLRLCGPTASIVGPTMDLCAHDPEHAWLCHLQILQITKLFGASL
jgi:hypothetical protein